MTKVATMETRRFVAMVLIVAMLAAMLPMAVVAVLPGGVLAADNSQITCNFTTSNGAPVINTIALSGSGTMNPGSTYDITVNISDPSTYYQ